MVESWNKFWEAFDRVYALEPDFMGQVIDLYVYTIFLVFIVQYLVMKRKKK